MRKTHDDSEKFGWPPRAWGRAFGCGLTKTYELMNERRIEYVKLGKKTLITTHPADFLASLADEKRDKPTPDSRD